MRILIANDGMDDAGGVATYLSAITVGLASRGHDVGYLHCHRPAAGSSSGPAAVSRHFGVLEHGLDHTVMAVRKWAPSVCFSHNMQPLEVERRLLAGWPVVKMLHGYFGTCIGGQKAHGFPSKTPCQRRFGASCLALYLPRRCGRLRMSAMAGGYRWAKQQASLLPRYAAVVVASEHMRQEYLRHGVDPTHLRAIPLFADVAEDAPSAAGPAPDPPRVLFLGRMTTIKGGDVLVEAAADASRRLGRPVRLVMAGDGPQRPQWEARARALGVDARFTGWLDAPGRRRALAEATLLAVPSVWPEPFGLAGLEAAACGVPAVAFDVGGIHDWLTDGLNGVLAPPPPRPTLLADAIVRALESPERLQGMRAAARAVAGRFTLEAHLGTLEPLLAAAATGSGGAAVAPRGS